MIERTRMVLLGTTAKRYSFSRSFLRRNSARDENVWFYVFQCPVCGAIKRPLVNPNRGREFYCSTRHPTHKEPG